MKSMKRLLAMLLCAAMLLSLVACGGGAPGGNAGGNGGGSGQSGSSQTGNNGGDNKEENNSPGKPSGGSLAGMVGMWSTGSLDDLIYIDENGEWGNYVSYREKEPAGEAKVENGKLYLMADDEEYVFTYADNSWVTDGISLVKISTLVPHVDELPQELIGCWKMDDDHQWVTIQEDTTWYASDVNGEILYEGYVYVESNGVALISDEVPPFIYILEDDGSLDDGGSSYGPMHQVSGNGQSDRVEAPSGANEASYVGVWQYMNAEHTMMELCVYIESDGSWTSVDSTDRVVAQGWTDLTADQLTMDLYGNGDELWTMAEDGLMYSAAGMKLGKLERIVDPSAAAMSMMVGQWRYINRYQLITINEDGTWYSENESGDYLDSGVVSVDPEEDETVVLLSDNGKYPRIISQGYLWNTDLYSHNLKPLLESDDTRYTKYIGLWEYPQRDVYIQFNYNGNGMEIAKDGTVTGNSYMMFHDEESGQFAMMTPGPAVALVDDGSGNLLDREGNVVLRPADITAGLDKYSILRCAGVWYHPGQDVYLKITGKMFAFWDGEEICFIADRNNVQVASGFIAYGLDTHYTITFRDGTVWELTLGEDGSFTDGNGIRLIPEYGVTYSTRAY